jgi:protein-tyrosine-phosphatase
VEVARHRGLDLSAHRSTLVGPVGRNGANLVVVMEPGQGRAIQSLFARDARDIVVLGDLDPEPIAMRAIEDPVEQGEAVFERSYARIDRCVEQLARSLFG